MKGKKNKKFRSHLEFYEMHFKFKPPYKVLIDGTFLARAEKINLSLSTKLYNIFKKKFILSTTKCIKHELSLLGSDFERVKDTADSLLFEQKCFHSMILEPSNCILKYVGSENKPQYIIATCDQKLIRQLQTIPKCPILTFVSDNVLDFKEPSQASKNLLDKRDAQKYEPSGKEKEVIVQVKKADRIQLIQKRIEKLKSITNSLGVQIKKKANAPNPLSVKSSSKKKKNLNDKVKERMVKNK